MGDYLQSWLVNWDNYFSSEFGSSSRYVSDVNCRLTPHLKSYISLLQRAITPPNGFDVNNIYVQRFFVSLRKTLDILPNLLTKHPLYPNTVLEFIDIYYLCLHCFDLFTLELRDDPYVEIDYQRKKYYDCLRYWGVYNEVDVVVSGESNKTLDGKIDPTMNESNEIGGVLNGEENEKEDKKDENVIDEDLVKEEKEFEKDEESCTDDVEDHICKDDFGGDKMVQGEGCVVTSIKPYIDKGKEQKIGEQIVQGHFQEDSDVESMSDGLNNARTYGFKDIFDEPAVDCARYDHTMRFWDPGGENRVTCVCHHLLGPREKKYLFIKVEGHQLLFTRPKENEVEAWKFGKIKPSSAPYFYELDFDVAKRENKIWDAGGKISIDCSEMVINVTSGNSFPIFQSIIGVIALCSNLNNFDSLDIRVWGLKLMVLVHSIRIWDPGRCNFDRCLGNIPLACHHALSACSFS